MTFPASARNAAARKLGWRHIPAEIVPASDEDAIAMAFSENCDRIDFSDYEKAFLLWRLHALTGKSYTGIAKLVNRSPAFVSLHVAMLTLFQDLKIPEGQLKRIMNALSERHCRFLSKIEDVEERWNTAKLVVKSNLGVRDLEKICNRMGAGKRKVPSNSSNDQEEIKFIIFQRISGLSSRNLRDYYKSICEKHFTLFSMFPDLDEIEIDPDSGLAGDLRDPSRAKEYTSKILRMLTSVKLDIQNLRIRTMGNLAYATLSLDQEFDADGERFKARTRETLVFEKEKKWKLVHEHTSTTNPLLLKKIALSRQEFAATVDR